MPYNFDGNQYNTREEAEQAKAQYEQDRQDRIMSTYADAASVGFDENRYNALMASGGGLSQMSKEERSFIQDRYAKSGSAGTYTKSATDQYLMSIGLPPSKSMASYRKQYSAYSANGGLADNYGGLNEAQWKKINELWAKDWEYGLTDEDARRKALGYAPVAYDDMYEDTLLDDELKANGLPPSKLLNGKLGETYNTWVKDATDYAGYNDAVTRKMIEKGGKPKASDGTVEGLASSVAATLSNPNGNLYTLQDAIAEVNADPKWSAFAHEHTKAEQRIPGQYDSKYVIKETDENGNKYDVTDANGEPIYNTDAWLEDQAKAYAKNAEIANDEFALTFDKIDEYYNENYAITKADMRAEQWFADNKVALDYGNRFANQTYIDKVNDYYYAESFAADGGYTLDNLFPNAEFTDEERTKLQPLVDEANRLSVEQGFSAGQEYITGGGFAAALRGIEHEDIVAATRATFGGDKHGYNDPESKNYKTDEQILHDHYEKIAIEYGMDKEPGMTLDTAITKLMNGEITPDSFMREKCTDTESATKFAYDMTKSNLESKGLPTTLEELKPVVEKLHDVRLYIDQSGAMLTSMGEISAIGHNSAGVRELLSVSDEEFEAHYKEEREKMEALPWGDHTENREMYLGYLQKEEDTVRSMREHIREIMPEYYAPGRDYSTYNYDYVKGEYDNLKTNTLIDLGYALSYTPEFAKKTADKDYVNQRFNQIVGSYANSLTEAQDKAISSFATDEDKARVVYMFDYNKDGLETGKTYLNDYMMLKWDALRREEQQKETGYFNSEGKTGFGRWLGGLATVHAATSGLGITEGIVNWGIDTVTLLSGHTMYSSNRTNISKDQMGNLSEHLRDIDGNGVGAFAINLIPSMAQSAAGIAAMYATGGTSKLVEGIHLALMSSQSYDSAVDTALRNGATGEQAYLYGLINAANEAIFEKLSIEKFVKDINVVGAVLNASETTSRSQLAGILAKEMLKHAAVQGAVEASEETLTSIANLLAEQLVLKDKSEFNMTVKRLTDAGMSEEDAKAQAWKDLANSVIMDTVGGLVSGALMSFGGDIIMTGAGRIIADRTGVTEFLLQTHDLSRISVSDAIAYAQANVVRDSNGNVTLQSARDVMDALQKQGADASTLSRTMFEVAGNTPLPGVATLIQDRVAAQSRADKSKLLSSAEKYVYDKATAKRDGKATISKQQIDTVVTEWQNRLMDRVMTADLKEIDNVVQNWQTGYITDVVQTVTGSNVKVGMSTLHAYYKSLSAEAQAAIKENVANYKSTFNSATRKPGVAASYSLMAAVLEHATNDADVLRGLKSLFGDSASVSSTAVRNACLNSDGAAAMAYINEVCNGIAILQSQDGSHLFSAAQTGVNSAAYVAAQMALAQSMPTESMSRAMYDYIVKYGSTAEALDLLTAANLVASYGNSSMPALDTDFKTAEELRKIAGDYQKALANYNSKQAIMDAHEQSDAQNVTEEDARIAMYDTQIAQLQAMVDAETDPTLHGTLLKTLTDNAKARQEAISAKTKETARRAERMESTKADLESAKAAYEEAEDVYARAMARHALAYTQRFGAQLQGIMNRDHISHAELSNMTARVMYGTSEDLNAIEERILASEKAAAVALGKALGAEDVECVEFTTEFFDEKNVPEAERQENSKGVRIGGKIYLNTKVMSAKTGSLTDLVVLHEIGHILESSGVYAQYAKWAEQYMRNDGEYGNENVDEFLNRLKAKGMSEKAAKRELVAEFTRQIALSDTRAVTALCKAAPQLSMRVFQWLTNTRAQMSATTAQQSKIVVDAQRAFAKGIKAIRSGKVDLNQQAEETTTTKRTTPAFKEANKALSDRAALEEQKTKAQPTEDTTQTEQSETRQAEQPAIEKPIPTETEEAVEEVAMPGDYGEYDVPTEVGKVESINSDFGLDEGEFFEDSDGNKWVYDEDGNLVRYTEEQELPSEDFAEVDDQNVSIDEVERRVEESQTDTSAPTADVDNTESEEYNETASEETPVSLPFELSAETRDRIMRVVASIRINESDADGRVSSSTNNKIANLVKNQVKHDVNYVDTPADVLDAYANSFKAPQREAEVQNDVFEYQRRLMQGNGKATPSQFNSSADPTRTGAFSEIQQDYVPRSQYMTEYNPAKDYKTYMTPEAQEHWTKVYEGKKIAYPSLAWLVEASKNNALVPYEVLMSLPEIQAAQAKVDEKKGTSSAEKYRNDSKRKELQASIAATMLDEKHGSAVMEMRDGKLKIVKDADGNDRFDGAVRKENQAYIIWGRSSSGKSDVFANRLSYENGARIVDPDTAKEMLNPGFENGIGAGFVHEESSDISKAVLDELLDKNSPVYGENIILPRVGSPKSAIKLVNQLRAAGYEISVFFDEVSAETSLTRASARFANKGRYLDVTYLHDEQSGPRTDNDPFNGFYAAMDQFGDIIKYAEWRNNNVDYGTEPEYVWSTSAEDGRTLKEVVDGIRASEAAGVQDGRSGGLLRRSDVREGRSGTQGNAASDTDGRENQVDYYTEYDYGRSFSEQVDDFFDGKFPKDQALIMGGTPQVWKDIGLASLPLAYTTSHADYIRGTYKSNDPYADPRDHVFTREQLKNLPSLLADPIAIITSRTDRIGSLVALIDVKAANGKNSIAAVKIDGKAYVNDGRKADVHFVTSFHGRSQTNVKSMLEEAFKSTDFRDVFYWNKNKVLSLAKSIRAILPSELPSTPYVHRITDSEVDVKSSSGITHQTDTQQFDRWWRGSLARTKTGTPLKLYQARIGNFGETYLSTNPKYAGNEVMYASIKYPFTMRLSESRAIEAYEKYGSKNTSREDAIDALTDRSTAFKTLREYARSNGMNISELLTDLGFDGVYDGSSWVALRRNQVKSASEDDNSGLFSKSSNPYYYTEYDPQAKAVRTFMDGLTDEQMQRCGNPRMIETDNGFVVARTVSPEGFMMGNPMFSTSKPNIAMIAPVSEFRDGDVGRAVPAGRCKAVVMPNSSEYASLRADARDAGTSVYGYSESDPTAFDRAVDYAANQSNIQYMPEIGYDEWVAKYGKHPLGAQPRVENRPVPRQTTATNRVSQMAANAASAPVTTEDTFENGIKNWIANGTGTFEPISNARSLDKARGFIERAGSISQAARDLHSDVANSNGKATDLLARAEILYAQSQNEDSGLTDLEREQIFGDMCIIASDAGRALQLASQLKYMTAEGHIAYMEQVGRRMADRYQKRTKKRVRLELTEEEKAAYKGAVTEEERGEIDKKVGERFADETSDLTFLDRVRNWRYFSMLGNPRTHFRNMVGNALMNPVARVKDTINAGYQALAGIDQSERTTVAITGRVDADVKDWVEDQLQQALPIMQGVSSKYLEEAQKRGDTSETGLRALWQDVASSAVSKGRTAVGRFLNKLSSFNSNALEYEDAKALGWRFRSSMYQIIKARGLDVHNMTETQRNDIVNYAMEESLRATFRDASALSDAINKFANTNRATQFFMEAIIPFKKTPINIAKRSIEYSPLGLVQGFYKLFSAKSMYNTDIQNGISEQEALATYKRQKIAAIDRLAAGTTGSLMTAIGLFAAAMGWISIGRKDDEEAAFEQSLGKNVYSLNIGDLSIDLSAFSPAAVPLLMGAALYEAIDVERDEHIVSALISTLAESVDPITEMSMLSGLADSLQGISYSSNEDGGGTRYLGTVAGNAVSSYVGQFVPTFLGQVARVTDPYARSYTAGDDYWATKIAGSGVGTVVKGLQNKIPFAAWLSEPKVDLHGNPVKNYTNWGSYILHPLNNFILPATIKVDSKNEIDDELVRLYGVVDSDKIFPTKPSRSLGSVSGKNGTEQIKITSDAEYTQYQEEYGQTVYDMLEDLMRSSAYKRMNDVQKAEAVEKTIEQAKSATKKRWKAQKTSDKNRKR